MIKKIKFLCSILIFTPIVFTFSQEIEKIAYVDYGSDGSQYIPKTINGIFIGFTQKEIKQEGNLRVTYQSYNLINSNGWSEWEVVERRPMERTITLEYNLLHTGIIKAPDIGTLLSMGGGTFLQMYAIPSGRTSPIWWATSGNSFYLLFKLYLIVN